MTFDEYLTQFYGFNTKDGKWKRMGNKGKNLLLESFKIDMSKAEDDTKLAKLYPSNKE